MAEKGRREEGVSMHSTLRGVKTGEEDGKHTLTIPILGRNNGNEGNNTDE